MKYLALSVILILSVSLNSCSGDKTSSTKNSSSEEIKNAAASKTIGGDNGNVVSDGGVNVRKQSGALKSKTNNAIVKEDPSQGVFATIKTNKGDIVLKLAYQRAPVTVANFVALAEGKMENNKKDMGVPFFDGLNFHRVISKTNGDGQDFMIQGGCPEMSGRGNPGYRFQDEFHPELKHNAEGVLSMANSGPHTNGSQFFITVAPTPHLDGKHSVFGHVIKGMDVAKGKIKAKDDIISITIDRVGANAAKFDAVKVFAEGAQKLTR